MRRVGVFYSVSVSEINAMEDSSGMRIKVDDGVGATLNPASEAFKGGTKINVLLSQGQRFKRSTRCPGEEWRRKRTARRGEEKPVKEVFVKEEAEKKIAQGFGQYEHMPRAVGDRSAGGEGDRTQADSRAHNCTLAGIYYVFQVLFSTEITAKPSWSLVPRAF